MELNIWARLFASHSDKFEPGKIAELGKPFRNLLDTIAKLRHTTVHRIRISSRTLEQFLFDAESLAVLLEDDTCAREVSRLRREAGTITDELGRNKDLLESRLMEQLKEITGRRAELDKLEQQAIKDMLKEDKEYQDFAGENLERAISKSELQTVAVSDEENVSEVEADVEADDRSRVYKDGSIFLVGFSAYLSFIRYGGRFSSCFSRLVLAQSE